ncbi:hypothetical protein BGP_0001 [Beggiatoa sp. PS]|nr:hypothetical protein BGP_0001 [Beggiatoa sp. PS]
MIMQYFNFSHGTMTGMNLNGFIITVYWCGLTSFTQLQNIGLNAGEQCGFIRFLKIFMRIVWIFVEHINEITSHFAH